MKIVTYVLKNQLAENSLPSTLENMEHIGFLADGDKKVIPFENIGVKAKTVNDLIDSYSLEELIDIVKSYDKNVEAIDLEKVKLCAPIPRPKQDVICLGINYLAHAEESARYKKEAFERERVYPIYFSKRVNLAVADGDPVDSHRDMFENLDYEDELAVIIGKTSKNLTKENAKSHIFGYTILNDISAREIQTRHKQWYFGKSLDQFTPMGPCILTADEVQYPPALNIKSYVNGELRQNSNTNLLINDIDYILCELTQGMTLLPGTIISTGTPAGVGMGFEPPKFLKPGDEVCCEIEGIGKLINPID